MSTRLWALDPGGYYYLNSCYENQQKFGKTPYYYMLIDIVSDLEYHPLRKVSTRKQSYNIRKPHDSHHKASKAIIQAIIQHPKPLLPTSSAI